MKNGAPIVALPGNDDFFASRLATRLSCSRPQVELHQFPDGETRIRIDPEANYATTLVVVTSQEIGSLRHAGTLAETLRQRYGAPRVKVVVNRFERDAVIAHADVERAVGGAVQHMIPSDYRSAVEALNAGRPIVLEDGTRLGSAVRALARDLAGIRKEAAERSTGVLGRLAWRRA